jgi:predicted AAA+ superfamily ATPase
MPKLYFYDTGLACSLLGIQNEKQLSTHYSGGNLFESFVLSEIIKYRLNKGLEPHCYYWRDRTGNEVDCIMENNKSLFSIEVKFSKTIVDDSFSGLKYWGRVAGKAGSRPYLIYNGKERQKRSYGEVIGWKSISSILE